MNLNMMIPGWPKLQALKGPVTAETLGRNDLAHALARPIFLREVAQWDLRWQRLLFQILVPARLLMDRCIDPVTLTDAQGRSVAFSRHDADRGSFRLELYPWGDADEAMGEIELADTVFNQIEVVWVVLQDPSAPRFDVDVLPNGAPTMRGTAVRNIVAEEAAMIAGLAPGQVRRGLKVARWLMERVETLMLCLNQREFVVQPLYYHAAVLFERFGFSYIQGQARMESIEEGFALGGELRARLDNSTPFRRPEQAKTVRGRSWAIHDGILDEPWDRVRMVKRLGVDAGVNTCSGIPW